ncbi:hypothetical protein JZ751_026022 [Albula glossodonta]|uniref:Tetraspanin n=1 Tax=Albula glossodonta TaxID=121402 RepID=A0A8T2MST8_9TELE|nr:hypothetical protein JZ751_026022 [Albula glossodonta]
MDLGGPHSCDHRVFLDEQDGKRPPGKQQGDRTQTADRGHGYGGASARGTAMEGDCLSCIKYLMFVFNFFIFLGGSFLLGVGIWVLVDPTGFREIVAANPLLFTGAYIILAMGGMLFLLGFLGCCGAIRENKCLLLFVSDWGARQGGGVVSGMCGGGRGRVVWARSCGVGEQGRRRLIRFFEDQVGRPGKVGLWEFFLLILIIFLAELAAAILAFIFREHLTREYFTSELKNRYQGYNNTDFDCCGVNSPEDFEDSLFRRMNPSDMVPEACCQRNSHPGDVTYSSREDCLMGSMLYRNNKGCYSAVVDYFETYIYLAGALAIVVLTIEVSNTSVLSLL